MAPTSLTNGVSGYAHRYPTPADTLKIALQWAVSRRLTCCCVPIVRRALPPRPRPHYMSITGLSSCGSWISALAKPTNFLPCCSLLIPSCGVEMVAPWTRNEYAYNKVHSDATAIDNKGTNIKGGGWSRRRPVLPAEALHLLKAYPRVSSWGLAGHASSVTQPAFRARVEVWPGRAARLVAQHSQLGKLVSLCHVSPMEQ